MLYNMVDRIYIGHIPDIGGLALTGVGVCMPLIMIVSAFAALVGSGGAPRASIFMGQGHIDTAEKTLGNCFSMQLIISVILTIILFGWNKELLLAFGASENTIMYGVEYMNIYAIGTILRTIDFRYECLYHRTRIYKGQHDFCTHRCHFEYNSRPYLYFLF